jgi:alcohol dehydrogenase class IV
MVMQVGGAVFEFATAQRIVFGRGTAAQAEALAASLGSRVLLVTGSDATRHGLFVQSPKVHITREPTTQDADRGSLLAREMRAEVVVAIGGGSVLDAGKAIAALATQPQGWQRYLEVVGEGQPLDAMPLPFIALPTTAGTGAEATRNAVLTSEAHGVKASLRHASMLPRIAVIDPELARGLPASITAASGMDALTQCLEAFVCSRAQPLTDALCRDGIQRAARSLQRAYEQGDDLDAREDMALCALYSGMALANAGLGAVHGFAAPLGGSFHAPHGAICAALLGPVWRQNASRVLARGTEAQQAKFAEVDAMLGGDALTWIEEMTATLHIPKLREWGITATSWNEIAIKAAKASSMKANPVMLEHDELITILREAT